MNSGPRVGHTLIEVLIALALLAVLIGLIAGLMSTFGRAEATAQRTAIEMRTLRTVRRQLEEDLQRLVTASDSTSPLPSSSASVESEAFDAPSNIGLGGFAPIDRRPSPRRSDLVFDGTSLGFRCRIELDDDAGVWLETLVAPSDSDIVGETDATSLASPIDSLASSPRSPLGPSDSGSPIGSARRMPIEADLEYRLASDPEFPGFGRRLRRTLTPRTPPISITRSAGPAANMVDPNTILDASDLYRTSPSTNSDAIDLAVDSMVSRTLIADGIANARFRYSDGTGWYRNWNGAARGKLPRAIELTFDPIDPNRPSVDDPRSPIDPLTGEPTTSPSLEDRADADRFGNEAASDPFGEVGSADEVELPETESTDRETAVRWVLLLIRSETDPLPVSESAVPTGGRATTNVMRAEGLR
ncbi:MAG TPA: hypothetical protein DCQ98_20025 [Planctomycetaceae bacterium]|nr:hypothetical protein [Planctomycetaceae bacterium]HRE99098.1 hypothetical protein [Pirellulaceae bacterium]